MNNYPVNQQQLQQQAEAKEDDGVNVSSGHHSNDQLQQRYPPPPMPVQPNYQHQQQQQQQYPYKYPGMQNVVYYMNEQDNSSQHLSRRASNSVLPTMYYQGNMFPGSPQSAPPQPQPPQQQQPPQQPPQQQHPYYQYPPSLSRTAPPALPLYQYYPIYPPIGQSPPRDAAAVATVATAAAAPQPQQPVYMEGSGPGGVLPSLQMQQPLMQQPRGKQRLSMPFHAARPQTVPAPPQDHRIATAHQQPPLPLPTVPPPGWITDTNDSGLDRRSLKRSLDQGFVHKCHLCNKSFKRRSWLKRHLLSHSPDRHFACPWCLSKHKRKDNLLQHMKLKHTDYVLQELRLHDIKVDGGFLTISSNNEGNSNNTTNNIRSLLYEGKLNKDEVKKVLNSLIDKHNHAHN